MRVIDQITRLALHDYPAMFQDVAAVAEAQRMADILLDHEHGSALVGDFAHRLENVLDEDRGKT